MRQIVAMGGGGFSMEPENPRLDRYILSLVDNPRPKICFFPTASGDAQGYIDRFYEFFNKETCEPSHFSVFKPSTLEIETFLLSQDIIYVGGGNTVNMLVLWKEWGIDKVLHKAWEKGIVLAGLSAGSICWFEQGVTDSYGDELYPMDALGLLKGSHSPHYDGEVNRRPSYQHLIQTEKLLPGYAVDDGAALHFRGTDLYKIVTSRPAAKAYYVQLENGEINETALDVEFLEE